MRGARCAGNSQTRFLLVVIALLSVVWWSTLPETSESPVASQEAPSLEIVPEGDLPSWLSDIDTSRPECVRMQQEMLAATARGEQFNIYYIGDCDKRLQSFAEE